jgi:hypothetical protein
MKLFNNIIYIAAICLLCGCSKDDVVEEQSVPKKYTVSLKFNGEIETEDSPLTRAETASTDLYGIQVSQGNYSYAYGLFDNPNNIKLNLLSGNKYKFEVSLIKDGKNAVYSYMDKYYQPFKVSGSPIACSNYFSYNRNRFTSLGVGEISTSTSNSVILPEVDWYYGELDNYTPIENGVVNIELKHTVFGLRYEVAGITDGIVKVEIKYGSRIFFNKTDITSDYTSDGKIFAVYDIRSGWLYADNYTEKVTVDVKWVRDIGITQDLGSKSIQVKRNIMNVIRIKLGSDDSDSSIGITTEDDSSMNGEEIEIPLS